MSRKVYIIGILAFLIPSAALAYTRTPSDAAPEEPITFTVEQSDFQGGSCPNGYFGSLQVRFNGQSVGYGSIIDWGVSDGSSDITFTDVVVSEGWALEYAPHPTTEDLPINVLSVYAICNATTTIDYGWSAANMTDTFIWSAAAEPETPTTTETVEAINNLGNLFALASVVVIALMSALFFAKVWK